MKKKFLLIAALIAALALVFIACPGDGDGGDDTGGDNNGQTGDPEAVDLEEVFSETKETQSKSTVTINGDTVTIAYRNNAEIWGELVAKTDDGGKFWDASAYTGIKFDYKTTGKATIFIQDDNTIYTFGYNDSDGWGAVPEQSDWTEIILPFSITKYPDKNATDIWFGEKKPINPGAIEKIAFQVNNSTSSSKFELRNLKGY